MIKDMRALLRGVVGTCGEEVSFTLSPTTLHSTFPPILSLFQHNNDELCACVFVCSGEEGGVLQLYDGW